jgi:CRP/FNR family cyclic AMP-dependent transcriptional regulator
MVTAQRWVQGTFLDRLGPDVRTELLSLAVRRRFAAGRHLLREGETSSHVELLLQGFVKVTTVVEDVEALLSIRMPGDILGETGALGERPRTATVTACGPVVSAVVTKPAFSRFLREHPEASFNMAAVMGERLRWANQQRADFTAYSAEVRLGRLLLEIARKCGHETDEGLSVGVSLSQPELATMIGAADATVQKAIRHLRDAGALVTGYRSITILDVAALQRICDD